MLFSTVNVRLGANFPSFAGYVDVLLHIKIPEIEAHSMLSGEYDEAAFCEETCLKRFHCFSNGAFSIKPGMVVEKRKFRRYKVGGSSNKYQIQSYEELAKFLGAPQQVPSSIL